MRTTLMMAVVISGFMSGGCATIMKSEKTPVQFSGGLSDGSTQINLPDGQFNAAGGSTTILVTRSREDIPITVTCNNVTRSGVLKTSYDPLAGIVGNIVFGGIIGIGIDAVGNKTYDPPRSFNLAPLCSDRGDSQRGIADGRTDMRNPSSDAP